MKKRVFCAQTRAVSLKKFCAIVLLFDFTKYFFERICTLYIAVPPKSVEKQKCTVTLEIFREINLHSMICSETVVVVVFTKFLRKVKFRYILIYSKTL